MGRDASAAIGLVASALMYALAPWIIGMLSPDRQVVLLGTQVLRIVVFSEPLFGASIVTAGVFRGGGQLTAQLCAELCQYVGRAYHADAADGAPLGAAESVDRHVHRAVLPRFTVFILPVAQTVAAAGAGVKEKSRVTENVTRDFWVEGGYGGRFRLREGGKSGMIEKTRKGEPP